MSSSIHYTQVGFGDLVIKLRVAKIFKRGVVIVRDICLEK